MDRRRPGQRRSSGRRFATALIAAGLAGPAGFAAADLIEPLSQTRGVFADASVEGIGDTDSTTAAAFEPFDACAMADAFGELESASATACQRSQIGSESVTGSGDASAFTDGISAFAGADSDFDFDFTIPSAVSYAFVASVNPDPTGGPALVWLTDVTRDETVAMVDWTGETHVSSEGRLDPGEYRIVAYATAIDFGGPADFNFSLSVPEPRAALLQLVALGTLGGLGVARRRSGWGIVRRGNWIHGNESSKKPRRLGAALAALQAVESSREFNRAIAPRRSAASQPRATQRARSHRGAGSRDPV